MFCLTCRPDALRWTNGRVTEATDPRPQGYGGPPASLFGDELGLTEAEKKAADFHPKPTVPSWMKRPPRKK